jgi:hypothetical protein
VAIRLEFISVVIPIENIERCKSIGGFQRFLESQTYFIGLTSWYDDYLYREGAMNSIDARNLVRSWETRGLRGLAGDNESREWMDLCLVDYVIGPTRPCSWLEHDQENHCVYMAGKPKGDIVGPAR